jgi:hypothetical protein
VKDLAAKLKLELISTAAFDERISVHVEAGYRVALALLRDPDEACDAEQGAAFKAQRSFRQLRDGRGARPWRLQCAEIPAGTAAATNGQPSRTARRWPRS